MLDHQLRHQLQQSPLRECRPSPVPSALNWKRTATERRPHFFECLPVGHRVVRGHASRDLCAMPKIGRCHLGRRLGRHPRPLALGTAKRPLGSMRVGVVAPARVQRVRKRHWSRAARARKRQPGAPSRSGLPLVIVVARLVAKAKYVRAVTGFLGDCFLTGQAVHIFLEYPRSASCWHTKLARTRDRGEKPDALLCTRMPCARPQSRIGTRFLDTFSETPATRGRLGLLRSHDRSSARGLQAEKLLWGVRPRECPLENTRRSR